MVLRIFDGTLEFREHATFFGKTAQIELRVDTLFVSFCIFVKGCKWQKTVPTYQKLRH